MSDSRNHPRIEQTLRKRAQRAETRVGELAAIIDEQNRMLLGVWLRGVLADPELFDPLVGVDRVLGADGRVDWAAVDRELEQLLRDRPYLAAPSPQNPWRLGRRALSWLLTGE